MTLLALCSFDLEDADADDYGDAYAELAKLGLNRRITSTQGSVIQLPTTMVAGEFTATSTGDLRDSLASQIKGAFQRRGFDSEIFVSVGDDWAWAHRTT